MNTASFDTVFARIGPLLWQQFLLECSLNAYFHPILKENNNKIEFSVIFKESFDSRTKGVKKYGIQLIFLVTFSLEIVLLQSYEVQ